MWLLDWRGRSGDEWVDELGGGVVEDALVDEAVDVVVVAEGTENSGGGVLGGEGSEVV